MSCQRIALAEPSQHPSNVALSLGSHDLSHLPSILQDILQGGGVVALGVFFHHPHTGPTH